MSSSSDPAPEPYRRAVRWDIPIDDNAHPIGGGPVLHAQTGTVGLTMQIWTDETDTEPPTRLVRTYADDQPIPATASHLATANARNGAWHTYTAHEEPA